MIALIFWLVILAIIVVAFVLLFQVALHLFLILLALGLWQTHSLLLQALAVFIIYLSLTSLLSNEE